MVCFRALTMSTEQISRYFERPKRLHLFRPLDQADCQGVVIGLDDAFLADACCALQYPEHELGPNCHHYGVYSVLSSYTLYDYPVQDYRIDSCRSNVCKDSVPTNTQRLT